MGTPLHIAAERNLKKISVMLMNHGADPRAASASNVTALEDAKRQRRSWADSKNGRLQKLMHDSMQKRQKGVQQVGRVKTSKTMPMGAMLAADVVAPKLVMTPVGYCPLDAEGNVIERKRGIRFAKRRRAPTAPNCKVNWYAPRG